MEGSNNTFVDVYLGGMGTSEEEQGVPVPNIKLETEEEDLGFTTPVIIRDYGMEEDGEEVSGKLEIEMSPGSASAEVDGSCPCACWREVEALKEVVREQGEKLLNLSNIVIKLLGKQVEVKDSKAAGKKVGMVPPPGKQSTVQREQAPEVKNTGTPGVTPVIKKISTVTGGTFLPTGSGSKYKLPENGTSSVSTGVPSKVPVSALNRPNVESRKKFRLHGSSSKNRSPEKITHLKRKHRSPSPQWKHRNSRYSNDGSRSPRTALPVPNKSPGTPGTRSAARFKCDRDHCRESFSTSRALHHHVRVDHEGLRYQCKFCTAYFVKRYSLTCHERIHVGGQPLLRCHLCGTEAPTEASLRSHYGNRHRGKTMKIIGTVPCPRCSQTFQCEETRYAFIYGGSMGSEKEPEFWRVLDDYEGNEYLI